MSSGGTWVFLLACLGIMKNSRMSTQIPPITRPYLFRSLFHLWDWGERKSRIKATEANIEIAEISLEEETEQYYSGYQKSLQESS